MRVRRRRLGQYRCWLCGGHLPITVAPYNRHHRDVCRCEDPGGWCNPPRGWTQEQVEEARRKYEPNARRLDPLRPPKDAPD